MLTVEGAYIAYALVSRDTHVAFNTLALLAALSFVVSIFLAGKGITAARDAGFDGNWSKTAGKTLFNLQAVSLVIGLVLLATMLFLSGAPKESEYQKKLADMSAAVDKVRTDAETERVKLLEEIRGLRQRLDKLESKPVPATVRRQQLSRNSGC